MRKRASSPALILHSGSNCLPCPRKVRDEASASTPHPRNASANRALHLCRSALRGLSRLPVRDSARTLMCTCRFAWWSCSTMMYLWPASSECANSRAARCHAQRFDTTGHRQHDVERFAPVAGLVDRRAAKAPVLDQPSQILPIGPPSAMKRCSYFFCQAVL